MIWICRAPGLDPGRIRVVGPTDTVEGTYPIYERMTPERARWFGRALIDTADAMEGLKACSE